MRQHHYNITISRLLHSHRRSVCHIGLAFKHMKHYTHKTLYNFTDTLLWWNFITPDTISKCNEKRARETCRCGLGCRCDGRIKRETDKKPLKWTYGWLKIYSASKKENKKKIGQVKVFDTRLRKKEINADLKDIPRSVYVSSFSFSLRLP